MKMFQTRNGDQLLYFGIDSFELGVRDETTRMLARKEWTLITNSETLHKILNLRCSHLTKHAWSKETHADNYPVKLCRRDGEMESGTSRFVTSNDDTSLDRGDTELERTR